ncbi:MAG: hypothetical protein JW888_18820 [Pirellulales bacterium]|nr:hypothetical protein [Pirellulales bacterium]
MHRFAARFLSAVAVAAVVFLSPCTSLGITLPDILSITGSTVHRWNLDSSSYIYSQSTGTSLFGDMTRTNDGRFVAYRSTYDGKTPALFQVNPTTGAASLLVESTAGAPHVIALAPMAGSDLLGYDEFLGFVRIDPSTLAYEVVPIEPSNSAITLSTGAMATSPSGEIYAWCSGFAAGATSVFSELFKIDPIEGTAQEIGGYPDLGGTTSFNAMAFSPDGRLFGFTEINAKAPLNTNSVYEFDLATGMPTWVAERSFLSGVRGAAFVPEPGMLALLASLALAMWGTRFRVRA